MKNKKREISEENIKKSGKLPQEIGAELKSRGITEADIYVSIRTDMDLNCDFTPGWLILTKGKKLISATADPLSGEIHFFKGMETRRIRCLGFEKCIRRTLGQRRISDSGS